MSSKAIWSVRSWSLQRTGEPIAENPDGSVQHLPDEDGILAIGSGANFALAAARALVEHTDKSAVEIVRQAMKIAADICVFTNHQLTLEEL